MRLIPRLLLLLAVTAAHADEPPAAEKPPVLQPYHAVYQARYNGLPIEAHRYLRVTDNGYQLVTEAKNFLGRIHEEENFHVDADNRLIPDDYRYQRSIFGKSRTETVTVDHDANKSVTRRKGREHQLDFAPGQLGPLSYQVAMAADLSHDVETLSYQVIHRGDIKQYRYRRLAEVDMDTPVGRLRTLPVERVRDDSDRETVLWLAPELNYLPVRLVQKEDGETYEMTLKSITLTPDTDSKTGDNDESR
ncbi:MAG: DUF3108 domain-containing protein [Porticoccaceae bacterium]